MRTLGLDAHSLLTQHRAYYNAEVVRVCMHMRIGRSSSSAVQRVTSKKVGVLFGGGGGDSDGGCVVAQRLLVCLGVLGCVHKFLFIVGSLILTRMYACSCCESLSYAGHCARDAKS